MKRISLLAIPAIAVSILVIFGQQPAPAAQTGTVRGVVVRNGTQDPIPDVQIAVRGVGGAAAPAPGPARAAALADSLRTLVSSSGPSSVLSAVSDSAGRFVINNVPLGQQVLTARREGYFGISTYDVPPANATATVTVSPQNPAEVSIAMVPGSAVSGKITESNGLPAVEVSVEIFRIGYLDGETILQPAGTRQTDDRGEYRLYRLPPGEYRLVANPRPTPRGNSSGGSNAPQPVMVRTFYPNTADISSASKITLKPADELNDVNIELQKVAGATISGHVVPVSAPTVGGRGGPSASLTLVPRNRNDIVDPRGAISLSASLASANNSPFQIPNVPPGEYDLYAIYSEPPPPPTPGSPPPVMTMTFGKTSLDVRGSDIDNVTIVLHRGIDIDGRLAIDGKSPTAAIPVSLQPIENGAVVAGLSAGRFQSPVGTDGNFKILAVPESLFRVQIGLTLPAPGVRGAAPSATPAGSPVLPSGAYVVDILQSGASVYDNGLRIASTQMAPIEIFVKTDGGKIQGIVHDSKGQPVPSAVIALVPPQDRRRNPALYKTATADDHGSFKLDAIAPGTYKLFAWPDIPAGGAYQSAEFLRQFEERGVLVSVTAGSNITQQLAVIR